MRVYSIRCKEQVFATKGCSMVCMKLWFERYCFSGASWRTTREALLEVLSVVVSAGLGDAEKQVLR